MTRIEQTVFISAPVDRVFSAASDWRRWEEWFVGVSGFRPTSETPWGNGARYAYLARVLGLPLRVETEITEYRENSGWVGVATKGLDHRSIWSFEPSSDGTEFTYALEYRLPPVIGALVDPLVKREWRRIIQASVLNLERLVTTDERLVQPSETTRHDKEDSPCIDSC